MLATAIRMPKSLTAIERIIAEKNSNRDNHAISPTDWKNAAMVNKFLDPFYQGSIFSITSFLAYTRK